MKTLLVLALCIMCRAIESFELVEEAYPSIGSCDVMKVRKTPKAHKKIIDITHALRKDVPSFGEEKPIGDVTKLVLSMADDGSDYNLSELKLIVHTGTHVDAPGHYVNEHYEAGWDVDSLDLDVLVGPVLIVDTPRDSNITARVLEELDIPLGVERILFRTSNTDKRLMWNPKFDSSFTAFTKDGAEWLVNHRPDVKLVGTDYLSVAIFEDLVGPHRVFLWKKLILVEALNLDDVPIGLSNLYCLPLRLLKAEGSPARCILLN